MRIGLLTREWPPDIYGGAGVHVEQLVRALRSRADVEVHCFGEPRPDAIAHSVPASLRSGNAAIQTLGTDLEMVGALHDLDLVHSHTWYTNMAGQLGALLHDIPFVLTAHSLEPLRPWKADQLGGGYRVSSWVERVTYPGADAIIAVSEGMRGDVLAAYPQVAADRVHVVHNGVDTDLWRRDSSHAALDDLGVDPARPYVLFVGRITQQKGLLHLLHAARRLDDDIVLVLCASAPDTPQIGAETAAAVDKLRTERGESSVVWIAEQAPRNVLIQLYSHALAFVCPSVYEPLGIVNLEAMACETAVVASAVGGIPEVVVDGVTGVLVPYDPAEPRAFEVALADAVNNLAAAPDRARRLGAAGRARAVTEFGWEAVADATLAVYAAARE